MFSSLNTNLHQNQTVSMSASGVHVISDAGIHLPHELHLPRTGLSHEANSALGAATAAVIASAAVSPVRPWLFDRGGATPRTRKALSLSSHLLSYPTTHTQTTQKQIMTVLDLAIIKAQLQKMGIGQAVKTVGGDLFRGRASWRPALPIMTSVYLSTYLTANGVEAYCTVRGFGFGLGSGFGIRFDPNRCKHPQTKAFTIRSIPPPIDQLLKQQEHGIDYKIPTALCTSFVNVVAIAMKDKAFARMMSKEPAAFPAASYGACMGVDGLGWSRKRLEQRSAPTNH